MKETEHAQPAAAADNDLPLIGRVREGDPRAFEELVCRHQRRVFRTTLAVTGNEADAEEALQDTFLKAYRHLDEFRGDARFTTWLTRIAVNEGLQRTRRHREFVSLDDPETPLEVVAPQRVETWGANPEKRYAAVELKRILEEAIAGLPPAYRLVFVLRDVEQAPTAEVAEALGLTVPGVKSRLLRARLMLREALARRFEKPGREGSMELTCQEVLANMSCYIDGDGSAELRRALGDHVAQCQRCHVLFDTTQETLHMVADAQPFEVPAGVSARMFNRLQGLRNR